MLEKYIEKKLRNEIKKRGGIAFKFVSPGRRGVSDRIDTLPNEKIWFVETKAPGKKLSPLQLIFKRDVEQLGFRFVQIDSDKNLSEFLKLIDSDI